MKEPVVEHNKELYQSVLPTKLKIIDREDYKTSLDISLA